MRNALLLAASLGLIVGCGDDDDPQDFQPWTLEQPSRGWQFITPEFDVPEGAEKQICYFLAVPDLNAGADVWVDKFKLAINPGSHHLNVFRVKTIVNLDGAPGDVVEDGECFKSPNWADWPLVVNSQKSNPQDPYTEWQLPTDPATNRPVAQRFTPGEKLMVQVHYVNAGTQETPFRARAGINFYASDATDPIEMGTLFATQQSIRICQSNPKPRYSGTCSFPEGEDITVIAANGHFHSRGRIFDIFAWDGSSLVQPPETARFYRSDNWDDPPMARDFMVPVASGGGIWWTCEFQWFAPQAPATCDDVNARDPEMADDCCYTFGPVVETSEHCNVFLYFYPKVNRTDIFCN